MIELDQLIALALDELTEAEAAPVEEHVLACGLCATRLERLLRLGDHVRALVHAGRTMSVGPPGLVEQLERQGLISRTYRIRPGQTVPCAVGAADVYSATHLEVDLTGVRRLDLLRSSPVGTARIEDVPFDASRPVATLLTRSDLIRTFPSMKLTFRLVAVDGDAERTLGEYVLDHTATP